MAHKPNDISPESYKHDKNYYTTKGGSVFADPKGVVRKADESKKKALEKVKGDKKAKDLPETAKRAWGGFGRMS